MLLGYVIHPPPAVAMHRTVASYLDPIEAHIVCGRLQAEGVDAHVADDQMNLVNWEWRQAIGGTKVRVTDAQFEQAQAVIAELDGGGFILDPEERVAALPHRETWSSRLALLFGLGFGLPLPWRRRQMDSGAEEGAPSSTRPGGAGFTPTEAGPA